jgi:DNA repair exonuclease SbcCD ATPase subunit
MVILKKLKLTNFLSYKDAEINFKENSKLNIVGISGSGKSSIVEAIIWALYGKGRVENRNIIKRGAKFATVVLTVVDDKQEYRIERSVTMAGKHTLGINEKKAKSYVPMKHIGLRDAQEWLEKKLIKSSYTLFINSVAYPQDNLESFVKQTAIKRKELLLEIANTESYDELYNQARRKLDEFKEASVRNEMLIQGYDIAIKEKELLFNDLPFMAARFTIVTNELATLRDRITMAKKAAEYLGKLRNQIDKNKAMVESKMLMIANYEETIKSKTLRIAETNRYDSMEAAESLRRLAEIRPIIQQLKTSKMADYEASLRRQALISSKGPKNDYSAVLERLEGQLLEITINTDLYCPDLGKVCPKLEKEIKNKTFFLEEQIKDIKERMNKQTMVDAEYEIALTAIPLPVLTETDLERLEELEREEEKLIPYENYAIAHEEMNKNIEYLNKEIMDLNMTIAIIRNGVESLETENQALEGELTALTADDPAELEISSDKYKSEYFELEQKIKIATKASKDAEIIKAERLAVAKKEFEAASKKESLEMIKEAFGSTGIKTVIIDYLIPRLEYRINDILSKMSDFKIRLETQKTKFDGEGQTEGLFINVYNEAGEAFSFNNYSGGQKLKVTVAIAEALATLQKSGFRIYDEVFTAFDENSLEGFNEVIHSLQDRFSQILCISHLQTIQDSFEEKLRVVKEGDTSKIII